MIAGDNHSMIKKPRTQKTLDITIQQSTLLRELRVAKLATPTAGTAKPLDCTIQYSILPIPYSLLLITYVHADGRCRAGQGSNVSVLAP